MTLHAPQIIYLILLLIGLGVAIEKHGKPKSNEGNHSCVSSVLATALVVWLLWWGGFFGT